MQRQCAKVGTAVDDGSDSCGYESVDLADAGRGSVEYVIDADVLHEVEMHHEVAKDTLDGWYRGYNGVVKPVHVVKDWHGFYEYLLRYHKETDVSNTGAF